MFLSVALLSVSLSGCEYDDGDLWNAVGDVENRVTTLEEQVKQANSDIKTLNLLVEALQKQVTVTSVTENSDGYVIAFSDGKTATIANGQNGTNAPVVSVKQDTDGVYYWTLDGEWLLDNGEKVRASAKDGADGANAVSPQVRINESSKEWEISTDGGQSWSSTGVVAQGQDGQNGTNGSNGSDGDSFFKRVDTSNEEYVIFVLSNDTEIKLARYDASAPTFVIEGGDEVQCIKQGTSKSFAVTATNVADYAIAKPDGWRVSYTNDALQVTAPAAANTYAEQEGVIAISLVSKSGKSLIAKLSVKAVDYELRVLSFEDADFKATPWALEYCGVTINTWSDLIDSEQYGGSLLYSDSSSAQYNWNDANNTFLATEAPENYGGYAYWGGGHAISNYCSTDLEGADYTRQLEVYYQDAKTGYGGHNGSKNFCMHYGYRDNGYASQNNLPYLYFYDGEARVIDHMWVMNSTYAVSTYLDGNGLTASISNGDWVKVVATGYNEESEVSGTCEFYLCNGPDNIVLNWTKWDLSSLGAVTMVEFNITGSSDNGYGFSQPAYFAYDDVAVRF